MSELLFYLSIIPSLAIVLAWHEAGHLWAARLTGVKASAFSIGAGPALFSAFTGRTQYTIGPALTTYNADGQMPKVGARVVVHYRRLPDGAREALSITERRQFSAPYKHRGKLDSPQWAQLREQISHDSRNYVTIAGRIRSLDQDTLVLADMQWRVGAIPFAAYIAMPEDPARQDRDTFNSAGFFKRTAIMAAGVFANLILPIFAFMIIFTLPTPVQAETVTVLEVTPGSPAERAGIRPNDAINVINDHVLPSMAQTAESFTGSETVTLRLQSPGERSRNVTITKDTATGKFGITFGSSLYQRESSRSPTTVLQGTYQSTLNLYTAFYRAAHRMIAQPQPNQLTSAVGFTVHNADIVAKTGIAGWLLMMSILSLSAAIFNLLPVPPLDGGKMVFIIIETIRRGEPIPYRYQYAITSAGIGLILTLGIFLVIQDTIAIF